MAWSLIWSAGIKRVLLQHARGLLDVVSPRARDRILKRRLRRSRPPWLAPTDAELIGRLEQRPLQPAHVEAAAGEGAYVRALRRLPQSPMLSMQLEQSVAWAGPTRFSFLFPYFDRDLVELSLRIPPEHLLAGGRAKAPLRQLVAERLAAVAIPGSKVLFGRLFDPLLREHGRRAWTALGGPVALADLGVVDPDPVNAFMQGYFEGRAGRTLDAWLVLSMELWLRSRSGWVIDR
jgi:hypothetical protein